MSLNSYGYDGRVHTYKAPIVDLYNATDAALMQLENESEFGKEFMKVVGNDVRKLLNSISKNFDEWCITDTKSLDYLMSDKVWFNVNELRARIRGANEPLNKVNLVPLVEVLIAQLRRRVVMLDRANMASEYTAGLCDALQTTLSLIPEQQEKKIRVPDRRKKSDEEAEEDQKDDEETKDATTNNEQEKGTTGLKMREITIKYEPFVDQLTVGFSAAAKVQRASNQQKRETQKAQGNNNKDGTWKKVQRNKKQ